MNYKFIGDGHSYDIVKTDDEVDNEQVFKSLTSAKRKALEVITQGIARLREEADHIKNITDENINDGL